MVSPRAGAVTRAGAPGFTPKSDLLSAFLFLGLSLVLTVLLERSFPIDSDEGYTLNAAWQLWNGSRMYDDFRLFVGPGSGYAVFWLWKLLGSTSHVGARLLAVGFSFSSTVALYLLLRRNGIRALGLALTVVGWLFVCALYVPLNHNTFSSYAAIWFLVPFLRLVELPDQGRTQRDPRVDQILSGLAAGLVFLFLPTKGLLLAVAAAAFLRATRPALTLLGAFVLVTAPLFLRWGPGTLIRQWLIIPLTGGYLGHTSASGPLVVVVLLVLALLGWVAIRLEDRRLKALTVVQAAVCASISHNMEPNHLAINAFPAVIFVSLALQRLLERRVRIPRFSSELTLAIVVATVLAWSFFSPVGRRCFSGSTLDVDLLGHQPKLLSSPRLEAAHAIYAGPFLPGFYYLFQKRNPFFVSETVVCDDACQQRLVGELAAVRPELAFLNYAMISHLKYDQNAPVDAYLREHYVYCGTRGFFIVRAAEARFCP